MSNAQAELIVGYIVDNQVDVLDDDEMIDTLYIAERFDISYSVAKEVTRLLNQYEL